MDVLILTAFVSLVLVVASLAFFAWNVRQRSHEYAEQLSLLPLQDDPGQMEQPRSSGQPETGQGEDHADHPSHV